MRGLEGFFSPLLPPRPVNTAAQRPWDGQEEKKNGDSESDPADRSSPPPPPSSAGERPSELPSQHPELAPPSASSFGSVPSPGRESNKTENNRELRRRLTAGAAAVVAAPAPSAPRRARQHDDGYHDQRDRCLPASRTCLCRICACLAIVAFLGIILVMRLIMLFGNGPVAELPPGGSPVGVAGPAIVRPVTPVVMPAEELPAQGILQANAEADKQPALLETMPTASTLTNGQESLARKATTTDVDTNVDDAEHFVAEEEEVCWVLMHMEKSGGGAVRQIASEFWRRDAVVFDTVQWRRGDVYAEDVMSSHWKLLHGGCVETLRGDNAPPCKWLTIFRHPVARLLSAYDHCRRAPIDPLCPPAKSKDLATFAERWGNFAMRQFALASLSQSAVKEWAARAQVPKGVSVWYLVKQYLTRGGVAEDVVLEGLLQPVRDVLSTQYAAVGIATELDSTMRLFEKALPVKGLGWSSSWSQVRRQDKEQDVEYDNAESATFRDALANPRIASALRLDIMLYDHALRVFQKQALHHGVA